MYKNKAKINNNLINNNLNNKYKQSNKNQIKIQQNK
jgi:hypothetical protein